MRAILIASAVALLLTGTSHASSTYYLAKPDASSQAFRHDQLMCERASSRTTFVHAYMHTNSNGSASVGNGAHTRYSNSAFLQCMADKGYRQDPNGYRTGRLWFFASRR